MCVLRRFSFMFFFVFAYNVLTVYVNNLVKWRPVKQVASAVSCARQRIRGLMACVAISWRTIVLFGAQARLPLRTMRKLTVDWRPYVAVRCRRAVAVVFVPRGVLSLRSTSSQVAVVWP
jgi:hypothetical protein